LEIWLIHKEINKIWYYLRFLEKEKQNPYFRPAALLLFPLSPWPTPLSRTGLAHSLLFIFPPAYSLKALYLVSVISDNA
jgi:hypothetical protein